MVDGYTEEGYTYTLVGTEKNIKCVFRGKKIEVYEYDHLNHCNACPDIKKPYTGRGYVIYSGTNNIWHSPLQFCPEHFITYHDMFVGLESDDP